MLGKIQNKIRLWKKWLVQDGAFVLRHLETYAANKRVILCDTADHDNLGDHAIALAELQFIREYLPDFAVIEIPGGNILRHTKLYQTLLRDTDVIAISGGGFLGSLWEYEEKIVQRILCSFSENKIVIFPQTFFLNEHEQNFFGTHRGYLDHKRLYICLRDLESCERIQRMAPSLSDRILYMPDMVLGLVPKLAPVERRGIGVCFRQDIECVLCPEDRELLMQTLQKMAEPVETLSTIAEHFVSPKERKEAVYKTLELFAGKKLILTDRLHAMLFAAITGTPCIALNNKSGKVLGTYRWIQDQKYIRFAENMKEVMQILPHLELQSTYSMERSFVDEYWKQLRTIFEEMYE